MGVVGISDQHGALLGSVLRMRTVKLLSVWEGFTLNSNGVDVGFGA